MTDNPGIVTLREYTESRLEAIKEATDSRLMAIKEAMAVADRTLDHRLAQMNELRDQINTERSEYVKRLDCETHHRLLDSDIRMLRESKAALDSKASSTVAYSTGIVAVVSLVVAILGLIRSFM